MAKIVFSVVEKMFSAGKIVIFLVEIIIGVSQKHFSDAEIVILTSATGFSIPEKTVGEIKSLTTNHTKYTKNFSFRVFHD